MAFTATVKAVTLVDDKIVVGVQFADSATGFTSNKGYNFPGDADVTSMQASIVADGTVLKNNLAKNNNLVSKVGTVITI